MTKGEEGNGRTNSLTKPYGVMKGFVYTILKRGIGARKPYSPTIQGLRKETLNTYLAAQLGLEGSPTSGKHPTLESFRVDPFVSMRMCSRMSGATPSNWFQRYQSIS